MNKTNKPGKQRKFLKTAKLHEKRKLMHVHLSRELRKQFKKRSLLARKEDKVKVMSGKFAGKEGKVEVMNYKKVRVFISGLTRKKRDGTEKPVPFHPSKLLLLEAGGKLEDRL